jgi:hypothetical protein
MQIIGIYNVLCVVYVIHLWYLQTLLTNTCALLKANSDSKCTSEKQNPKSNLLLVETFTLK